MIFTKKMKLISRFWKFIWNELHLSLVRFREKSRKYNVNCIHSTKNWPTLKSTVLQRQSSDFLQIFTQIKVLNCVSVFWSLLMWICENSSGYPELLILFTTFLSKSRQTQMWFVSYEISKSRYEFHFFCNNCKKYHSYRENSQMHATGPQRRSQTPLYGNLRLMSRRWCPPIRRERPIE